MGRLLGAMKPNDLDEGDVYRSLRRFWHPVMYAADLSDAPAPAVVLGEQVVVVRLDGAVRAFRDLCAHRGTALSLGWVEEEHLVCAYHGWTYRADGVCTRIPARHGAHIPPRARLKPYSAVERAGLIWVCLDGEPALPLPELPEWDDPAYRRVSIPAYEWKCSAARRIENFVDFSHFPWVHEGVLGSRDKPGIPDHDVERVGPELRFGISLEEVVDPLKHESEEAAGGTIRRYTDYRLFMPFTVYLNQRLPGDEHFVLFMAACPVGPDRTRCFTLNPRNYLLDEVDRRFVDFQELILEQDRPVVESQRPEELPVDLSAELHIRGVDRVSIEYRRWLVELTRSQASA